MEANIPALFPLQRHRGMQDSHFIGPGCLEEWFPQCNLRASPAHDSRVSPVLNAVAKHLTRRKVYLAQGWIHHGGEAVVCQWA